MGEADRGTETERHATTSPVAESDGYAIGILFIELLEVGGILLHVGAQLLHIGLAHIGHGVECCLDGEIGETVECFPDLLFEQLAVLCLTSGGIELKVGAHVTHLTVCLCVGIMALLALLGLLLCHQCLRLSHETLRLCECPLCECVVIAGQCFAGSCKHRGSLEVEARVAGGERPHVVGGATTLTVGRYLIGFQTGVVMQTVGDRGGIAQMMVVVEYGVGECLSHVTDLLCLCHEVQRTMLDELQDVGHAIGTVQIDIALLLTDKGLVAHRLEELPCPHEVHDHIDV